MIPHPHSENLEKKRKEPPTNTNTTHTIITTLDTSVAIIITVVTKTIIAITNIINISTIVVSDNTISIIVILSNTTSNIHYVISYTIYTYLNNDNTKLTSNDDNMNSSIIKDNSFTQVNRCKDIRIHKTEDTINILS